MEEIVETTASVTPTPPPNPPPATGRAPEPAPDGAAPEVPHDALADLQERAHPFA
jgi:hypothetical protein